MKKRTYTITDYDETVAVNFDNKAYVVSSIDLGSIDANLSSYVGAGQYGQTITARSYGTRDVSIQGHILAENSESMKSRKAILQKIIVPTTDFWLVIDNKYKILLTAQSTIEYNKNWYRNNELLTSFTIEATASNPFFQTIEPVSANITGWVKDFHFPYCNAVFAWNKISKSDFSDIELWGKEAGMTTTTEVPSIFPDGESKTEQMMMLTASKNTRVYYWTKNLDSKGFSHTIGETYHLTLWYYVLASSAASTLSIRVGDTQIIKECKFLAGESNWNKVDIIYTAQNSGSLTLRLLSASTVCIYHPCLTLAPSQSEWCTTEEEAKAAGEHWDTPLGKFTFGHRSESKVVDLKNESEVETGMLINFKAIGGTIVNPYLEDVEGNKKLQVNCTLEAGEELSINTAFGEKSITNETTGKNYLHLLDLNSDWLQMPVGLSSFKYGFDESSTGTLECNVSYTPQLIEV